MKAWVKVDMTNADWWQRVVQARGDHEDLLPQRMWTLRKGTSEAAIDLRAVPGIGAEIVLTVDGELRRTPVLPGTRTGGTVRRDRGHAGGVRGEGVGVMKSDRQLQRVELVIVVAVFVFVLIAYAVSRL